MATNTKLFTVTGDAELIRNIIAIEEHVQNEIPIALEEAATKITIAMMKRLVPTDTGKLRDSIRFTFGRAQGEIRRTKKPRSREGAKTRITGYIIAGDKTTMVGGGKPKPTYTNKLTNKVHTRKGRAARFWQNARLQEFGTVKMKAHPYFYPAWRATKKAVAHQIMLEMRKAMKRIRGLQTPKATAESEAA